VREVSVFGVGVSFITPQCATGKNAPKVGDAHNYGMEVYTLNGDENGSEQGTGSRSEPSVSAS
jgi:hypothetical protein